MLDSRISTLLSLSLITSSIGPQPIGTPPSISSLSTVAASEVSSSQRTSVRKMKNQLASTPVLEPMGTYVGELQEQWQFPSDHLPIGMSLGDLNFASWNVLDAEYMGWVIEKNSQGLSRSMIADEHVYIGDSKLTVRDRHVVDLILGMLEHPSHPKHLLSLQECGEPFLAELQARLPFNYSVVSHDGNAMVVDLLHFEVVEAKSVANVFSNEPERAIQDVILKSKDSGEIFHLVNGHLPGDPSKPARFEFVQYLEKTFDPNITTIAMGDMNFNELEMADALKQTFSDSSQPFSLYSPYCTNISPFAFNSKVIDHFFVHSTKNAVIHDPNQVMIGLDSTAKLLSK